MKMTRDELLEKYNRFVETQQSHQYSSTEHYTIEPWFFDTLTEEEEMKLEAILDKPTRNWQVTFWEEVARNKSTEYRELESKKKDVKKLRLRLRDTEERVAGRTKKTTTLSETQSLISEARNNGLFVSYEHLQWYRENGLIEPFYTDDEGLEYYHIAQIFELDRINDAKLDSLATGELLQLPDRTAAMTRVGNWQEHVQLNKRILTDDVATLQLKRMYESLFYLGDFFIHVRERVLKNEGFKAFPKEFPQQIRRDRSALIEKMQAKMHLDDGMVKGWMDTFAQRAIDHNPLLAKVETLPSMMDFFQEIAKQHTVRRGRRLNPYAVADFYYKQVKNFLFLYNGLTGNAHAIEEIFDRQVVKTDTPKMRNCESCDTPFIPVRKNNVYCPKKACKDEATARRGKKRDEKEKRKKRQKKLERNKKLLK